MREQEMAVNVAKQIYFDEFNLFYQIAERSKADTNSIDVFIQTCMVHDITEEFTYMLDGCHSYTKDGLYRVGVKAIYKTLGKLKVSYNDSEIDCYLEYIEKIIDEILKQLVVLGGEQNSSN